MMYLAGLKTTSPHEKTLTVPVATSFRHAIPPSIAYAQLRSNVTDLVELVNPLIGTDSKPSLSNGNTYPAIALPWGMNFWMPQTGKMGDGWAYTYAADKIRGFKQTHQPSPWMNDYGQFSIMPITGKLRIDEDERASWYSHKAEMAKPYYYSVYLADHDVTTEIAPTERAAIFRFTFPKTDSSFMVIDAFDKARTSKFCPNERKIIGYTTRNSGGVPANFKNYFVIHFDKPFTSPRPGRTSSWPRTRWKFRRTTPGRLWASRPRKASRFRPGWPRRSSATSRPN